MSRHYVLVGSGIAALAAAEAVRAADAAGRITLVSEEPHPFYSRPALAYLLTRELPERQLFIRSPQEVQALGIERLHARAERLLPASHELLLADGRRLGYDRLLLATGAASLAPGFPGAELEGVLRLDALDDARRLLERARRRRRAVVVGGGSTALELVEGLHARGMRVHYLLRGARYWPKVLDAEESQIVADRLTNAGVRLHPRTEVARALGRRGRLEAVETTAGERIECALLAVAVGVRPRLELARAAGLEVARGIVVTPELQASDADVFAAGDVAQLRDPRTGLAPLDTLWTSALAQGRAAGRTLAGLPTACAAALPLNVTRLAGVVTTIAGEVGGGEDADLLTLTRGQSERWRARSGTWTAAAGHGADRVRLVLDERRVVGAVVMGDQHLSQPIVELIRREVDLSPIRAQLAADAEAAIPRLFAFAAAELAPVLNPAPGGRGWPALLPSAAT